MDTRRFALEHLAAHLHAARQWDRLFLLIDEGRHRVQQAVHFESFDRPGADLEQHALPAAIEKGDWERFSRYTLMATNLRGLAEELADEEILNALARQGQSRLAAGLAGQLSDPLRRIWARAILASSSEDPDRAGLVRAVYDELEDLNGPVTGDRFPLLQNIARHLGPELDELWHSRLAGWVPGRTEQQDLRWTLAEAWAARSGLLDSRCREILTSIDVEILIERLAGLWLRYGPDDLSEARKLAADLGDPESRLFWNVAVAVLNRQAPTAADSGWAERAWEEQTASGPPVPWSPALIEQGRDLFGRFSTSAADRLAAELSDPGHRAALRVIRLELRRDLERAGPAFQAVEALLEPAPKLHWALRTALAWPAGDPAEKKRLAWILTDHLHRLRYAVEARDLARFLDLVEATDPDALRVQTDNVIWAPHMKPEILLTLAESVARPAVLAGLIERGESYTAVVGATEAEGFELRTRLLIRAACRLSRLQESWEGLDEKVVKKLLPDEEDQLRETAARELAALGKTEDAWPLTEKIRSPRRRLIAQLSIDPDRAAFQPEDLYQAVASVDAAEDERLALEMLAEPPLDPEALIESYLTRMRSRERQVQALIDLARRAQALEELHREGQRDPMAPLQLVRSSLTAVGSDEHLLGLTLELVELAAPLQRARALAEVHEAIEVILLRLDVPWEARREAFETLLARLGPILLERPMRNREFMARCGAVAGLVNLIVDLPDKAEESPAREELRDHWHEVFPVVLAAAARMTGLVSAHLAHPLRARIWGHWLPEISQLVGWERSWQILGRFEDQLPRSWRDRLRTRWNGIAFERFTAPWEWLKDDQKEFLRLCFEDPRELPDRITGSAGARGLAFRLAAADPERLPEVLRHFEEPERSRLALCLLRDGWVCPEKCPAVLSHLLADIADPALRLDAELRQEGESWLGALAERVAQHGLDPSDPPAWSLLRRLRSEAQPEAVPVLANAVLDSLPRGRERGEEAFRVWLNGFLAPRAESNGETLEQAGRVREALQKALQLGPAPREGESRGRGEIAARRDDDERGRVPRTYRRWTIAQSQGQQRRLWGLLEKREGFAGISILIAFFSAFILIFVDLNLRSPREVPFHFSWWLVALPLLFLVNTKVHEHILRNRAPGSLPRAWRIGLALACGVPFLGLYAFPAAARWVPDSERPRQPLSLITPRGSHRFRFRLLGDRWLKMLFREWSGGFYLATNMVVLVYIVSGKSWATTWFSVILHAAAASAIGLCSHYGIVKISPALRLTAASLALFPVPGIPLLSLVLLARAFPRRTEDTVIRALDEARKSSLRSPRGLELRDAWRRIRSSGLRNWMFSFFDRENQARKRTTTERYIDGLYIIKSAALFFEGAALSWLIDWSTGSSLLVFRLIRNVSFWVFLALGGIGLLLMLIHPLRRWFGSKKKLSFLGRHQVYLYMVIGPLVFVLGLGSYGEDGQGLGGVLGGFSMIGAAISLLRHVLSILGRRARSDSNLGWFAFFAVLIFIGFQMDNGHKWTEAVLQVFEICTVIVPCAVPVFTLCLLLSALLQPFGAGDILDPAWPRPLRRTLLFLTVTALLPLGGLAVPAWIWLRDRYWPRFEREWQERVSRSRGDHLPDIYGRWAHALRQGPRGRWWEKQTRFGDVGLTVAFFATVFLVFVDLALRSTPPAEPASPSRFTWWLAALSLLFLMNAQILGRILQSRAPRTLPLRWRIGTAVASGVPFLGLYAFAAAARRMSGSGKSQEEPLALEAPGGSQPPHSRSLDDRWTRVVVREWSAMLYFVSNLIVLLWIFSALPGRTWGTVGVSVLLHAAAASGLVLHVLAGARTARAVQVPPSNLLVPASLTLFTVPFVPFLGFVLYAFAIPRLAERTLPRVLLESRAAPTREKRRELTDTDRSFLWIYALKSASLIADGAALSWLAYSAAEELTSQRGIIWVVIDWVFGVGLALGGVGLLLMLIRMLIRTLQRWFRIKSLLGFLDRNPAHRYLAASQLALVMGLFLGYQLFAGNGRRVGEVVALVALCGTVVSFPRIFLSAPGEADRTVARAGWTVFFAAFAISGFEWANGHEPTEAMLWLFGICTALFPLAVPLFIRRQLLVRLLAPFGPDDMRDLAWSRPLRRSLRFLTVTALLPFGGLAVPAWIWVRYRHWPRFEREWHERMSAAR